MRMTAEITAMETTTVVDAVATAANQCRHHLITEGEMVISVGVTAEVEAEAGVQVRWRLELR